MERLGVRPVIRAGASVLAAALALAWVGPAHAAPETSASAPSAADLARARALFARGEAAAAAGRWQEAIARFEEVLAIKETPGVVFHLGAAREGAGQLAAALGLFERARALAEQGGVADVLPLAEARIEHLGHRVPRLVVRVPDPDESRDVRLDGAPLPPERWGEPTRVDPGTHRVEATVRGEPFAREVALPEGALLTVVVGDAAAPTITPAAVAPAAAPAPSDLPSMGLPASTAPAVAAPGAEAAPAAVPWGPILLASGGVVLAGAGVGTFVAAGSEADAGAEGCAAGGAACDPSARDTVRALDVASLGLWIAGAAAVGGAIVWWSLDDATVEARVGPGTVAAAGRF